jgi:hypothetical protein
MRRWPRFLLSGVRVGQQKMKVLLRVNDLFLFQVAQQFVDNKSGRHGLDRADHLPEPTLSCVFSEIWVSQFLWCIVIKRKFGRVGIRHLMLVVYKKIQKENPKAVTP